MFPKINDIKNNLVIDANFLSYQFNLEKAQQFAQAFANNTSIQKLEFVNCGITDNIFAELAKGILGRKQPFTHINLDVNHLTPNSFPLLKEIIQQRKCQHLMFYGNVDPLDYVTRLDSYKDEIQNLEDLANNTNSKIYLHYDNPTTRSYKGFFEILRNNYCSNLPKYHEESKEESNHFQNKQ